MLQGRLTCRDCERISVVQILQILVCVLREQSQARSVAIESSKGTTDRPATISTASISYPFVMPDRPGLWNSLYRAPVQVTMTRWSARS